MDECQHEMSIVIPEFGRRATGCHDDNGGLWYMCVLCHRYVELRSKTGIRRWQIHFTGEELPDAPG